MVKFECDEGWISKKARQRKKPHQVLLSPKQDRIRVGLQDDLSLIDVEPPEFYSRGVRDVKHANQYAILTNTIHNDTTITFSPEERGGRCYHDLTRLKREYRECLRFEGQPFVEQDAASSQLYFLGKLSGDRELIASTHRGFYEQLQHECFLDSVDRAAVKELVMLWLFGRLPTQTPANTFNMEAYRGRLLSFDQFKICMEFLDRDKYNKRVRRYNSKSQQMDVNFDANELREKICKWEMSIHTRQAINDYFEKHFPIAAKYVRDVKAINYKHLSWKTQRAESEVFIHQLIPACWENGIHPVFPIHDSIFAPHKYLSLLKQVIENKLSELGEEMKLK
jgi:hypothetical protein